MNDFGLTPEDAHLIETILKEALKEKKSFKIDVFGSRADNSFRKYSDLDLWIEAHPPLSLSELTKLRDKFEDSPIAIHIDLVTPENCLPDYLPSINQKRRFWF